MKLPQRSKITSHLALAVTYLSSRARRVISAGGRRGGWRRRPGRRPQSRCPLTKVDDAAAPWQVALLTRFRV
jgi:hypothetical protein